MKKTIYLAVITLITIGCVLYGVNSWYGGNIGFSWSFGTGNPKYNIEESATLETFDSITVDAAVMDLVVKEGSRYALDYRGTKNLVMSYKVDDGKLVITQKKKGNMVGNNSAVMTLTVPEDTQLERADIGIDVGDIDISKLTIDEMDTDIDVGDITITNTAFEDIVIDGDTGDVEMIECSFMNLDIATDVGDVEVGSSIDISEYTYDLKTDVGEVEVGTGEYGRKYKQDGKNGEITIHGDVGDITVK